MLPVIELLAQHRTAVSVMAGVIALLVTIVLARTSGGNRTRIRMDAHSGGINNIGDNYGIISTGRIGGSATVQPAGPGNQPANAGHTPRSADTIIAIVGVVVALAGVIVAVVAWLYPREPVAGHPPTAAVRSSSAAAAPLVVQEPARFALIFGNSRYEGGTWAALSNPGNDATAVSKALQVLRFQIVGCGEAGICLDANHGTMDSAIRELRHHLEDHPGAIAFVYYSGHGAQARVDQDAPDQNFLVPIGSGVQEEFELASGAVPLQRVLDAINGAATQVGIIVLDACRNNALKRKDKSSGIRGMARVEAGGVVLAYATEPGQVALDGLPGTSSPLGPYARRLAEQLVVPGRSITDMFLDVRARVMADTGGKQKPETLIHLNRNVYLAGEKAGT